MPRSLKLYIAGVVAVGAHCTVAHDTCVCRSSRHCDSADFLPACRRSRSLLGMAFWIASHARWLCISRSAAAWDARQAVAVAPILAAMFLGGPAVGGWVAAIGTTEMRELRGRHSLVRHACQSRGLRVARSSWRVALRDGLTRDLASDLALSSSRSMVAAARLHVGNFAPGLAPAWPCARGRASSASWCR